MEMLISGYIISKMGSREWRRLHYVGQCWRKPGIDYKAYEVHGEAGFRVQYHKDSLDGVEVRMAAREVRGGEYSGVNTAVPGVSVDAALERAAPVWQALKILNRTRGETREATERDWEWDVDKWVW